MTIMNKETPDLILNAKNFVIDIIINIGFVQPTSYFFTQHLKEGKSAGIPATVVVGGGVDGKHEHFSLLCSQLTSQMHHLFLDLPLLRQILFFSPLAGFFAHC
jgi:hypothetical protein